MNRVAINLGFIQIYWYSLFIFLGMLTASILVIREAKKKKIDEDVLINLIFYSVLIGIIGARTYYVLFNINYYLANPSEIIAIWNGGLAIHGGLLAALIFIMFYTKKHNLKLIEILDVAVVGVIIAQAIGRWGNFFNGEAYGNITTYANLVNQGIPKFIIKGMLIDGSYRQPTFLYESLWNLIGFVILILIRKYNKKLKSGQLTGFYMIWYGIGRLIIESMRSDSLMLGNIKIAQLVSIIFIVIGTYLFTRYIKKESKYY